MVFFFESFFFHFYLFALKLFLLTSKPIDFFSQCPKPKQTSRATRTDLQTCFTNAPWIITAQSQIILFSIFQAALLLLPGGSWVQESPFSWEMLFPLQFGADSPVQQQGRVCSTAGSSLTLLSGCFWASFSCKTKTSFGQGNKNLLPPGFW